MKNLVLAERVTADKSHLFVLPKSRLQYEIAKQEKNRVAEKKRMEWYSQITGKPAPESLIEASEYRGTVWRVYGKAPNLSEDCFNYDYSRQSHPDPNYAFIPIIGLDNILGVNIDKHVSSALEKLSIEGKEENDFARVQLKERFWTVLGQKTVSGDVYLAQFTRADKKDSQSSKTESVLFFCRHDAPVFINKEGLICCSDGAHIPHRIYGFAEIPVSGIYHNQDERRDVALKGELTLQQVGSMTAHRNSFHQFSNYPNFWWSQLGLLYNKGSKKYRTIF